jgi:hypothetical protein
LAAAKLTCDISVLVKMAIVYDDNVRKRGSSQ